MYEQIYKTCPKCGETKDINEFYKSKTRKDGHTSWCKQCSNESHKKYVENNIEHLREYDKRDYHKNIDSHRNTAKKSYIKNKDSRNLTRKKNYKINRDKILKAQRLSNSSREEKIRNNNASNYINNKEIFKTKASERKRLLKEISDGTVNKKSLIDMYEFQNHKCDYCGCNLDSTKKHIDHIIPLSRGGLHTISNIHYVCSKCNHSKGDKLESEWSWDKQGVPLDGLHAKCKKCKNLYSSFECDACEDFDMFKK